MSALQWLINFVLHLDTQLPMIIHSIGGWTYLVLFIVIFIETGLVVMPFLPGDSLLFTAGTIAALPGSGINIWLAYGVMAAAAILGDTNNYWIGHYLGPKVFTGRYRWVKKEYLLHTQDFYERHGRKTIFLARFVPIIRSFAPFVAGIGRMTYFHFISYNIFGGLIWTALLLGVGFFLGNIPLIKNHFSLFLLVLIIVSTIPAFFEFVKARREGKQRKSSEAISLKKGLSEKTYDR